VVGEKTEKKPGKSGASNAGGEKREEDPGKTNPEKSEKSNWPLNIKSCAFVKKK